MQLFSSVVTHRNAANFSANGQRQALPQQLQLHENERKLQQVQLEDQRIQQIEYLHQQQLQQQQYQQQQILRQAQQEQQQQELQKQQTKMDEQQLQRQLQLQQIASISTSALLNVAPRLLKPGPPKNQNQIFATAETQEEQKLSSTMQTKTTNTATTIVTPEAVGKICSTNCTSNTAATACTNTVNTASAAATGCSNTATSNPLPPYKTVICRSYYSRGKCFRAEPEKCWFVHKVSEMRVPGDHNHHHQQQHNQQQLQLQQSVAKNNANTGNAISMVDDENCNTTASATLLIERLIGGSGRLTARQQGQQPQTTVPLLQLQLQQQKAKRLAVGDKGAAVGSSCFEKQSQLKGVAAEPATLSNACAKGQTAAVAIRERRGSTTKVSAGVVAKPMILASTVGAKGLGASTAAAATGTATATGEINAPPAPPPKPNPNATDPRLFKTEMCRFWEGSGGECRFGEGSHGFDELRRRRDDPESKLPAQNK
ncbi:hypothetical protein HK100_006260 [Physocladia obscura]|uniref:C3H1-type domain-containing protein n=1 Tax=Physocladia obscura TaxID=109957 RepID=A0AAD5SQP6_9FUNG|nr:hypothetical protein HK100_006260 [Physocladia obscura]